MIVRTGERIRQLREAAGLSAEKLAEKVGVAKTTIYRYEKGTIEKISAETVDAIAYALRTTSDYLLGKTNESTIGAADVIASDGKTHWMALTEGADIYKQLLHTTTEFLKELQRNPKRALLFDKSGRLTPSQLEAILKIVDEIIGERDGS